jgi:transcriptional regulator with XRE-family HTH domain
MTDSIGTDVDWARALLRVLGDELRRARKDHGWTRQDLLDQLGEDISLKAIATYELGTRKITVARLAAICQTLNTTAAEIIGRAYGRLSDNPDLALGWTIDLHAAARLHPAELTPLRRWRHLPLGQPQTAWLTRPALSAPQRYATSPPENSYATYHAATRPNDGRRHGSRIHPGRCPVQAGPPGQ